MVINYNTFKYPGKFDKTVTVTTGEGYAQVIHILGYVDPIPMGVMSVEPRKVDVGVLPAGRTTLVPLTVTNAGDAPMKVTSVVSQKYKATYWTGEMTVPAGEAATIEVSITPATAGRYLDIVMVHSDARNDIGKGYKAVLTGEAK